MSDISASEYVSRQEELNDEARQVMPWDASKCTYEMGALKQQVFACRTHNVGICYSCAIQCHTKCDLVELFTKRGFTCECGTEKDSNIDANNIRCQLRKNTEADIPSSTNRYGHNFDGRFCSCDEEYDPESNVVMLQCLLGTECNEDWYHDHCILGNEAGPCKKIEASNSECLTEGFPPLESFDGLICWKCIKRHHSVFQRMISHPLSEKIIEQVVPRNGTNESSNKSNVRKRNIDQVDSVLTPTVDYSILLKPGYSKHFKEIKEACSKDDKLFIFFESLAPFLLEDEHVYEPPIDVDDDRDTDDLLHNILQNDFDRGQAIAGISALNALKSRLTDFLKPFAESGQLVKEDDIKRFFVGRE